MVAMYRAEERRQQFRAAIEAAREGKSDVNITTFEGPEDEKNLEVITITIVFLLILSPFAPYFSMHFLQTHH